MKCDRWIVKWNFGGNLEMEDARHSTYELSQLGLAKSITRAVVIKQVADMFFLQIGNFFVPYHSSVGHLHFHAHDMFSETC
jgi:hypothetical protein